VTEKVVVRIAGSVPRAPRRTSDRHDLGRAGPRPPTTSMTAATKDKRNSGAMNQRKPERRTMFDQKKRPNAIIRAGLADASMGSLLRLPGPKQPREDKASG